MYQIVSNAAEYRQNLEQARAIFEARGLDTLYTVKDALLALYKQTSFDEEENVMARHDVAHILANAIFGTFKDEEAALVAEYLFFRGRYNKENPSVKPLFAHPAARAPELVEPALTERYNEGLIAGYGNFARHAIKILRSYGTRLSSLQLYDYIITLNHNLKTAERERQHFIEYLCPENPELLIQIEKLLMANEGIERIILRDSSRLSETEITNLQYSLRANEELFLAVSGGRLLCHLSPEELEALPLVFLGVTPTNPDENGFTQFLSLRPTLRSALRQDLHQATVYSAPACEPQAA